jgi:hypothetical protein
MISFLPPRFRGSFQVQPLTNLDQRRFKQFDQLAEELQQLATTHDVSITVQQTSVKETNRMAKLASVKADSQSYPVDTFKSDPTTYIDVISPNKRKEKAADKAVLSLLKAWLQDVEMPQKLADEPIQWVDSDNSFMYHPQSQSRQGGYPTYAPEPKWLAFPKQC